MNLTLLQAQQVLELTRIDGLTPDTIESAAKRARKRWHPDNVAYLNNPAETERHTRNFQSVDAAKDVLLSYIAGTYQAGEKTHGAQTQAPTKEPDEVIRENARSMQAKLAALWEQIRQTKFKWTSQRVAVSPGFKIRDLLRQDLDDDIASLSMISYCYGVFAFGVPAAILSAANQYLGIAALAVVAAHALSCIIGMIPLSRYWMPANIQPVVFWFINVGLAVFRWAERHTRDGAWWAKLLVLMPVLISMIWKNLVLRPLFFITGLIVKEKVIGAVEKEVSYYAGAADWYIEHLLKKVPSEMDHDELFDLSHVYSALGGYPHD